MSRLTGKEVYNLMEAYQAVYTPQVNEDFLWESYLTEESISEAYHTVADYLVFNEFVPGYHTAEVYMSEMPVEDIDSILFETGFINEQYLLEAGFFQNAANSAIGGVKRAGSAVAGGIRSAAGGADRAVGGAVRAGNSLASFAKKDIQKRVSDTIKTGQTISGGSQRAARAVAGGVQKAVTPVAQAVSGAAQRAVSAGQSALGGAARAVQGAGKAVVGGAQRAAGAVTGAAGAAGRRIGQEIEISRKVGAGEPLNKPTVAKPTPAAAPSSQYTKQNLGGAQYGAFKGGGGDAAIRKGSSAGEVVAQGRKNISKVVSGREMNVTAPGVVKSGFDMFDVVLGHLIGEGYADTEQAALQIMANMSEEWRESIISESLVDAAQGAGRVVIGGAKKVGRAVGGVVKRAVQGVGKAVVPSDPTKGY